MKLAAVGAAGASFGLGGCARRDSGIKTIRWVVDPNPIRVDQIAGFMKSDPPFRVNVDPDAGSQKVLTQLAGGIYPDLFTIYNPPTLRVFARKQVLMDVRPLMEERGVDINAFWPLLAPYMKYQNKVYGLPDNCGPYVIFYNKRLLKEAGFTSPKEGWSWQDLLEMARALTIRDRKGRTVQFGCGFVEPWIIFWQHGARMYTDDGKRCLMDSPECLEAAEFWASMRMKEKVTPTPTEEQSLAALGGWGGANNLFKAERIAMVVAGRWVSVEFRKNKELDWDVAPVPQLGRVKATLLASKCYSIAKGCKNLKESADFLAYLVSKTNQLIVANTGDGIPSVMKYAHSPEFLFNPEYPGERNNAMYLSEMKHAFAPEMSPYISELEAGTIFNEEMDEIWQSKKTASEACKSITQRINSLINRNIANPNLMD